jgi:ribosomal protein S18 acetylase RimI-like enzyme
MYFLRQLSSADRADFRALCQIALTVNPDDFMVTSKEELAIPRLAIEEALEQPGRGNFFIGAFMDRPAELAGIVGLVTSNLLKTRHCGRITSLFVHPAHRRRGVARTLLSRLLDQAAHDCLRIVRLEVVAGNRAAIALYESLGFIPYGREPAAYRFGDREWDLLLMTRDSQ